MKALLGAVLLFAGVAWGAVLYSENNEAPDRPAERPVIATITETLASSSTAAFAAEPQKKEVTVYVTNTGEKYHRDGCRHLRRSRNPMTLTEARRRGYEACKVCRPDR